jgi:tungstate transport system substrate-binding protein
MRSIFTVALVPLLLLSCGTPRSGSSDPVTIATTTSVADSGLLQHLAAVYRSEHGVQLRWHSVGSGRALKMVESGEATFAISHDAEAERALASRGGVLLQRPFMRNDFIIVGPRANPASLSASEPASDAFARIHAAGAPFASRGDGSGTHAREMRLWKATGADPAANPGYRAMGQPMGALLRAASELQAYTLTDRATFERLASALDLVILCERDPALENIYVATVMRPRGERSEELRFADWLVSPAGAAAIEGFSPEGRPLFRSLVASPAVSR